MRAVLEEERERAGVREGAVAAISRVGYESSPQRALVVRSRLVPSNSNLSELTIGFVLPCHGVHDEPELTTSRDTRTQLCVQIGTLNGFCHMPGDQCHQ